VVIGRTVHERIEPGEAMVDARLAPPDLVGVAARTPTGRRAMAIPLDDRAPPLVAGQRVDLYAGDAAPSGPGPDGLATGRLIARDAVVVDVDDRHVTVAVGNADVSAVAAALIESTVIIAVAGPDSASHTG